MAGRSTGWFFDLAAGQKQEWRIRLCRRFHLRQGFRLRLRLRWRYGATRAVSANAEDVALGQGASGQIRPNPTFASGFEAKTMFGRRGSTAPPGQAQSG
jgi:hypothetical protein